MSGATQRIDQDHRNFLLAKDRCVGRLVVVGLNRNEDVVCVCDCGETTAIDQPTWLTGKRYQCGFCDEWEKATPVQKIIGCSDTYDTLMSRARGAKDRCENPANSNYDNYGGRGIRFLFHDEEHYALTLWSLGWRYGDERTTDRIDVDGSYEPDNVRLASPSEQTRNRRVSVVVDTGDATVALATLAEQHGIAPGSSEYSRLSAFVATAKHHVYAQVMEKVTELSKLSEAA